jgi:hypothetical protein
MNTGTRSKHFHGKQHEKKYNRIKQIEIEIERERLKDLEVRVFVSGTFETRTTKMERIATCKLVSVHSR